MSAMRDFYLMRKRAFGPDPMVDFMLKYGKDYPIGPKTFSLPKKRQGQCFMNATHLVLEDRSLTYVEGQVIIYGVPIDHAWVVDPDGFVLENTLRADKENIFSYFGVPFRTDYVLKATQRNSVYGLLDPYYARKTAGKLFDKGLHDGQKWLTKEKV